MVTIFILLIECFIDIKKYFNLIKNYIKLILFIGFPLKKLL